MVVYRTRAASAPVDFPPIFRPRHHCLSTWTDMTANTFAPLTCSNERECSGMLLHFMKVYHGTANMRKLITVGQQFLADVGCASASSTCLACLRFEFPSEINSGTCFLTLFPVCFHHSYSRFSIQVLLPSCTEPRAGEDEKRRKEIIIIGPSRSARHSLHGRSRKLEIYF